MLFGHSLTGIIKAKRGIVVSERIEALLVPGFREPGIVERSPDRERWLCIRLDWAAFASMVVAKLERIRIIVMARRIQRSVFGNGIRDVVNMDTPLRCTWLHSPSVNAV